MIERPGPAPLSPEQLADGLHALREEVIARAAWLMREKYVDRGRAEPFYIIELRHAEQPEGDELLDEPLFALGPAVSAKSLTREQFGSGRGYFERVSREVALARLERFHSLYRGDLLHPPGASAVQPPRLAPGQGPAAPFALKRFHYRLRSPRHDLVGLGPESHTRGGGSALKGVVRDATTDEPVTGARIELESGAVGATRVSDAQGRFVVARWPPGRFSLRVVDAAIRVAAEAQAFEALSVTATSHANEPLAAVEVLLAAPDGATFAVRTDALGRGTSAPLPPLPYATETAPWRAGAQVSVEPATPADPPTALPPAVPVGSEATARVELDAPYAAALALDVRVRQGDAGAEPEVSSEPLRVGASIVFQPGSVVPGRSADRALDVMTAHLARGDRTGVRRLELRGAGDPSGSGQPGLGLRRAQAIQSIVAERLARAGVTGVDLRACEAATGAAAGVELWEQPASDVIWRQTPRDWIPRVTHWRHVPQVFGPDWTPVTPDLVQLPSPDGTLQERVNRALHQNAKLARHAFAMATLSDSGETLQYAGNRADETRYIASAAKLAIMLAAFQLREDLRQRHAGSGASAFADAPASWERQRLPKPHPQIEDILGLQEGEVMLAPRFRGDLEQTIIASDNKAATRCIVRLGFAYVASAVSAWGLATKESAGLWLADTYGTRSIRGQRHPKNTLSAQHFGEARALVAFMVLLAQGRLVSRDACVEMRALLRKPNSAPGSTDTPFGEGLGGRWNPARDELLSKLGLFNAWTDVVLYRGMQAEKQLHYAAALLDVAALADAKAIAKMLNRCVWNITSD